MIVQVIENLISNSVYWLKSEKEVRETQIKLSDSKNTLEVSDNSFTPQIDVVLDIDEREIKFTDNGPGVSPDLKDEIFLPFTTFKPPGEGKGLGLYISRENAIYHDAEIFLSEGRTVHSNRLNTFILKFTEKNHGKKNSSETTK